MARIPQHFIDTLLQRSDIADVVGRRVTLKRAGREFVACCPFHDEKTPSFTVVPAKQFYYCFGCGAHGTAIGFLMEYDRLEFPDAVEVLAGEFGLEMPHDAGTPTDNGPPRQPLYDALSAADRYYRRNLRHHQPAIDYLKQRGISGATAKRFGLGYAPNGSNGLTTRITDTTSAIKAGLLIERDNGNGTFERFRNRLMFPIRDTRGRTVAFGGRTLGEDRAKYLNSPETPVFHKSNQLYGLYEARQANRQLTRLLVVEGYMDVVALAERGFDNAVATLGTATTEAHIRLLFRYTDEVVFCFDGDEAGQRAADKALDRCLPALRGTRRARFLFVPDGEDPDSLVSSNNGSAHLKHLIETARSASTWLLERLRSGIDPDSVEGRTELIERARNPINSLPNDTYRNELILEIARLTGHAEEILHQRYGHTPENDKPNETAPWQRQDKAERQATIERSTVARALTRLLTDPALASSVTNLDGLRQSPIKGSSILADAIEFFSSQPESAAARWLERYRNDRHFERLQDLAADAPPGTRDARAAEFAECIRRLVPQPESYQALRARYQELLTQQSRHSLDAEAAQELRNIGHELAKR